MMLALRVSTHLHTSCFRGWLTNARHDAARRDAAIVPRNERRSPAVVVIAGSVSLSFQFNWVGREAGQVVGARIVSSYCCM